MREFLKSIAKKQADLLRWLEAQSFWRPVVGMSTLICAPVVNLARGTLNAFPALRKLEWLLEIESLTRRHPVLLAFSMVFLAWRGIQTTPLGHIGTDAIVYPLMGIISGFNPFLGLVCGGVYGAADLLQKLVLPDMFGARGWGDPNYWGAMCGYVVAYSSLMLMGVCPGMLSRCFRAAIRGILKKLFFRRAASAADGAVPMGEAAYPAAELIAAAIGGYAGGWLIMHQVAPVTEMPAFMWRPNPDVSCHQLEIGTHLQGRANIGGAGSAVGGTIPALIPPTQGPPPGGYGPEHDAATSARDKALDEYDRLKKQWDEQDATADKTDPNYERLRQQYQDYMDYLKQQAVANDAQAQAIAAATDQARNTRVLKGADGREYEIVYDPQSGQWRNAASGTYFDPSEFDRWQQDLVKNRQFMDAENEKTRRREDWFSKEMDQQAAQRKQQAEAAAYLGRIQQAALKHDLWNPGGPGDVVGKTDQLIKDIYAGKPIDWSAIHATRKYTGDSISGAVAPESSLRNQPGFMDTMSEAASGSLREIVTGKDAQGNSTLAGTAASLLGRLTAGVATAGWSEAAYTAANMGYAQHDAAMRGASDAEIFKAGFKTGVIEAGPTVLGGAMMHYFPKAFPNVARGVGEMLEPVGQAVKTADQAVQAGSKSLSNRMSNLFTTVPETLQPTRSAVSRVLTSGDPADLAKLYSEGGMDRLAQLQKSGALSADEAKVLNARLASRVSQNVDNGVRNTMRSFEAETGVKVKSSVIGDSGSSAKPGGNPKARTDFDATHTTNFDKADLAGYAEQRSRDLGRTVSMEEANNELQAKFGEHLTENVDRNLRADGFSRGVNDIDYKTYNGIGKGSGPGDAYPPGFTGSRMAAQGKGKMFESCSDGSISSHNISGQAVVDQHGMNQLAVTGDLPKDPTKFGANEFKDFSSQQVKSVTEHTDVKSLAKAMGREQDLAGRINNMAGNPVQAGQLSSAGLPTSPPGLDPKLVEISNQINRNPSQAMKVLQQNGFTEQSFGEAVRTNVTQYHGAIGGK
ncbi:hypothetical protein [uncultured Paludibaculum sp.]|uniref:hypothetical protein n=1 Tax=uncultured Paludibaculum sp. TaxID=1765020 RepID=UPI002AAA8E2D|nr:hypothetical protein [uncultured Paludibaculum sp.]